MSKLPMRSEGMRVKTYEVLSKAVEEGMEFGWRRAHKHSDAPSEAATKAQLVSAVLGEICEVFEFPDDE